MIEFSHIKQASERISSGIKRTACRKVDTLGAFGENDVFFKYENRQTAHSFKERGARNKLLCLSDAQKQKGVIAASAGNHAQGIARHATLLGIPSCIIMPKATPFNKIQATQNYGAKVILHGDVFDEAKEFALQKAEEEGLTFCDPFEDEYIIAGQGSVALEMLEDFPQIDTFIVPIGGGGLIAGMAIAAKHINPHIQILGVQSDVFPYMHARLHNLTIPPSRARTLAEGIAVKNPGKLNADIIKQYVDDILLVSEKDIEDAIYFLLEHEKVLAEGAGAAGLAAYMAHSKQFKQRHIGIPITGGNIDMRMLATSLMRGLVRAQKIISLSVLLDDVPGGLALTAQTIAAHGGNVIEVQHQRQFGNAAGNRVTLDVTVETQDKHHAEEILQALRREGLSVELKMAE